MIMIIYIFIYVVHTYTYIYYVYHVPSLFFKLLCTYAAVATEAASATVALAACTVAIIIYIICTS